ncbi:MAG: PQQ-binding-like beta-propeller repeat protein [Pirellulaceae bacterium]
MHRFFLDRRTALLLTVFLGAMMPRMASSDDWPTFRHDRSRSGITTEKLSPPLEPCWVYESLHGPQPAWGDPKSGPIENILELRRVHFDDAFQVVGSDGAIYYGSSSDNQLYCLDLKTGKIRWTKIVGGPIRLAPTLNEGRIYVASDDGWAYCLQAGDGTEVWKFQAAPTDQRVLGHGKMISLWPSRTSVLVDAGVAYFAAGIFPAEGVFLYAVDAATGELIWCNDSTGENPHSRVSPQGYLLASDSALYAPMGRVSPAAFRRDDGRLLYETSFGKNVGGSYALLAGDHVYTGTEEMVAFDQKTRDRFAAFPGRRMVVTDSAFYMATATHLQALDRKSRSEIWKTPSPCADELILAGDVLFAGGENRLMSVDAKTGKVLWDETVDGTAKGLSVVDGRLLVSTDGGRIYCFGPAGEENLGTTQPAIQANPFADSPWSALFSEAAQTILRKTGIQRGHCLVMGCETGQLAYELAKKTELRICVVSPDAEKVAAAREALQAAGLYGARVSVEQWPLDEIPYADYFANLIVSETAAVTGVWPGAPHEAARMLKPLGGTLMIGQPPAVPDGVAKLAGETVRQWVGEPALAGALEDWDDGAWAILKRGPLEGAGSWTNQYGNPGNTACGDDQRIQCPLGVLWFGRPGPGQMMNRHRRAAGPLSIDGRMFIQGENVVMCYDIYNGLKLWERQIPGAIRPNASHDSSNLSVNHLGLFVGTGAECLRLDPASGETLSRYKLEPAEGNFHRWGYLAAVGNRLYGSRAAGTGASDAIVAFDIDSGERVWMYHSKVISHNAITIGDGKVFLVTSAMTPAQREQILTPRRKQIMALPEAERAAALKELDKASLRLVVALDAETGEPQWEMPLDATDAGPATATMYQNGALLVFGVYLDGHYWKEFFAGQFESRRITAISGDSGSRLWSKQIGYRVRPLIIGDTLHAEPWAFDLATGDPVTRTNPFTGETEPWQFARPGHHCGAPSAAAGTLFFRSLTPGYYDLNGDFGTQHFAGQRTGCWINFIPAGGLVLMPEASTGCMCDFANMGTVVFQPGRQLKSWAYYSTQGPSTPVKHLSVNLGAAGDRRDSKDDLWLAFPRPRGSLVLAYDIATSFYRGGRFDRHNATYAKVRGSEDPWLFASAANGLKSCEVPLLEPGDGKALYRVRLAFTDPVNSEPGKRVFDIKIQGKSVAAEFDIAAAAGGSNQVVFREFEGIEVVDALAVELVAKDARAPASALPLLHGLEVERQAFTGLGCSVTDFLLNDIEPKQNGQVRLANLCDDDFSGILSFAPPAGLTVSPPTQAIVLRSGTRKELSIAAAVAPDTPAGAYEIPITLARADGSVELQRSIQVEHLGPRGRVVFAAVEDSTVSGRAVDRNFGTYGALAIDGGNTRMNDDHHSLAFVKFRIDVPGKPVSATLRITNAGNPTGDAGRVCLVEALWEETKITYQNRPATGRELARLGRLAENQVVERPIPIDLLQGSELSFVLDPTSTDGVDFLSRESGTPPELVVDFLTE